MKQLITPPLSAAILAIAMLLAMPSIAETETATNTHPATEKAEKKCLTVCAKWDNACSINPSTGAKRCRRMCKRFAQDCFEIEPDEDL